MYGLVMSMTDKVQRNRHVFFHSNDNGVSPCMSCRVATVGSARSNNPTTRSSIVKFCPQTTCNGYDRQCVIGIEDTDAVDGLLVAAFVDKEPQQQEGEEEEEAKDGDDDGDANDASW
jgi:hypothetical protein